MPNLGFDTQEGKLIEWLKQPGEAIAKGEPIALIESDKRAGSDSRRLTGAADTACPDRPDKSRGFAYRPAIGGRTRS